MGRLRRFVNAGEMACQAVAIGCLAHRMADVGGSTARCHQQQRTNGKGGASHRSSVAEGAAAH